VILKMTMLLKMILPVSEHTAGVGELQELVIYGASFPGCRGGRRKSSISTAVMA
jgi:hypothetical protein